MQRYLFLGLSLAAACYAFWLGASTHSPYSLVATAFVLGVILVSGLAFRLRCPRLSEGLSGLLLLAMAGVIGSKFLGLQFLTFDPFHDPRYAIFLMALLALTAVGIQLRWFVSRWLALALAGAGVVSAGLNLMPFCLEQSSYTWTLAIHIAGALAVIANLACADVRARFDEGASPLWSSQDVIARSIRWTIMAFFAAIPMLLVYSWMQPIVPATKIPGLALAIFLSLSIALTISRSVLGAIGLVLGGTALLVQSVATLSLAYELSSQHGRIALYYAAFWIPAGLTALHCGLRISRPVLRLLLGSGPGSPGTE